MTTEDEIRQVFGGATPVPQPTVRRGGPPAVTPATVTLTEAQIKWAIGAYAAAEGYAVGKVALRDAETDDPVDAPVSATVEVTPRRPRPDSAYDRETPR